MLNSVYCICKQYKKRLVTKNMSFEIKEKVGFVTGGASGIGLCIVNQLLKNGAKGIAIIDVNAVLGKKIEGDLWEIFGKNSCIFIHCNVAEFDELEDAFELTVKTFKQLDIVINNAGIADENDYKQMLGVNMNGCVFGTKLAIEKYLPTYKSGNEGMILNVSSVGGLYPVTLFPVYSGTKFGIVGFSRCYGAKEYYEKTNVKVVTVCPGATNTAMMTMKFITQSPEHVGECFISIIQKATTGSVWIIVDGKPEYEEHFPEMALLKMQE